MDRSNPHDASPAIATNDRPLRQPATEVDPPYPVPLACAQPTPLPDPLHPLTSACAREGREGGNAMERGRGEVYPLGSPSPRVAMMPRWISLVPPPIVVAVAAM